MDINLRCSFPTCDHDSSQNSSPGVSFHRVPEELSLRTAWMEALGQTNWEPEPGSIICSKHFLMGDFLETTMERQLQASPVLDRLKNDLEHDDLMTPCYVKVCRICFATDCKIYPMTSFRVLNAAYETLTGIMTADEEHLPRYLCAGCADRLMNCARFRRRSLRAHLMLLDVVRRHGQITVELIQSEIQNQNPFSSDPAEKPNEEYFDFANEDLEEVNKVTDEGGDTRLEDTGDDKNLNDIKLEIGYGTDYSYNSEDRTNDMAVKKVKTENNDLNYEEDVNGLCSSNLVKDIAVSSIIATNDTIKQDNVSVCSFILTEDIDENNKDNVDNDVIINQDIVNDEITSNKNLVENMESQHSFELIGKGTLLTREVEGKVKKVTQTLRDINEVKIDKQQTSEADGPFNDDTLRCDICPYQTDSDIQLMEHLKWHAANDKPYHCDMCDYKTDHKSNLKHHVRTHFDKEYCCNVCKKLFQHKSSVITHMKIHSGEKPYSCDLCKKAFRQKRNLQNHLLIHSGEKPHTCDVCKKAFRREHHLHSHLRIHCVEKPYSCDICKKKFSRKSALPSHLKIHSVEKSHACDVCKKTFSDNNNLRSHLRYHLKPFKCDVCNKPFSREHHLRRHLRIHSGEKPYSCDVCIKSFSQKHHLLRHLKIHSGEKKYSCDICKKTFSKELQAKRHLKRHTF